jgi:hypothetical protein
MARLVRCEHCQKEEPAGLLYPDGWIVLCFRKEPDLHCCSWACVQAVSTKHLPPFVERFIAADERFAPPPPPNSKVPKGMG